MKGRYINPFTDFGFKKIFGSEENKDILIDFLETLLPEKGKIKKLKFLKTEHLGNTQEDRKAVFDLYCENDRKEKFIVELQKAKQLYFKERSLYYATFAIQEQAIVGEWNFKINSVYTISLMDFVFDDTHKKQYIHDVQLIETKTGKVFNDKLRFIYIEMPKFSKEEKNLKTHLEKWMYVLKNLSKLEEMPSKVKERVFEKLFNSAEIANYSKQEREAYIQSQKYANDWKNVLDTTLQEGLEKGIEIGIEQGIQQGIEKGIQQGIEKGLEQGIEQGIEQGKAEAMRELALKSIEKGLDDTTIQEITGLKINEIIGLRKKIQKK
ncbi:MAG: Rpn family recombination-promoting nuclease/putative transposase [Raineya sp.]